MYNHLDICIISSHEFGHAKQGVIAHNYSNDEREAQAKLRGELFLSLRQLKVVGGSKPIKRGELVAGLPTATFLFTHNAFIFAIRSLNLI